MPHLRSTKELRCPLEYGLNIFGGKWKSRILCVLAVNKRLRYSDIRRDIVNITDAVLANTLKELIAQGMVSREQFDEIPPRVEYQLTAKGESVLPILRSICRWSSSYIKADAEADEETMPHCLHCRYNRLIDLPLETPPEESKSAKCAEKEFRQASV